MGFKSKIKPNEIEGLDFKTYTNMLKKEVVKAAKFGETSVVVFSNYKFACGHEGTLLLLGKYSGELVKFYKGAKLKRKKEKDFARGVCYFETKEDGSVTMHIALQEGVGKPDKIKKNGKALFKKLGLATNIFKGELPVVDENVNLSSQEIEEIEHTAEEENDLKALGRLGKEYKYAYENLVNQVLPLIKMKEGADFVPAHFEIAKAAFKASASFLAKYEEANDKKQDKFAKFYEGIKNQQGQLQKIAAKVKKELSNKAQVHGSSENVEAVLEEVETTIKDMRQKFQKAFDLIDKIVANKNL
jgi:small nuclear ribonucleoprotein (snRNP)-like protein